MENKIKIIIGTIIVILILGGYILNDKVIRPYYQEQGAAIIINQINANGNIPVLVEQNNQTIIQ